MSMDFTRFLTHINDCINSNNGVNISYMLRPSTQHSKDLVKELRNQNYQTLMRRFGGSLVAPWDEIAVRYVVMCSHIAAKKSGEAFKESLELYNTFLKLFEKSNGWLLNVLFVLSQTLRDLAHDAEAEGLAKGPWPPGEGPLQDAARSMTKGFTVCITDRQNTITESRKWGVYYLASLVFKFYFKLKQISLSKNILRAIDNADLPDLQQYPRAHRVAYRYYLGMIDFMNENYAKAEEEFTYTFYNCITTATTSQQRILLYLIALRMLRGILPTQELLSRFKEVQKLYTPFIDAIKAGNLKAYDEALERWELTLLKFNLYLILERAREICLRGLFRRVWLSEGKHKQIPVSRFYASLKVSGMNDTSMEEAECFVANMIYRGYLRGYISHEKQMVVLAGSNTFPALKDRQDPFSTLS